MKVTAAKKKHRSSSSTGISEQADTAPEGIEDLFKTKNVRLAHNPTKTQLTDEQKKEMQEKLRRVTMGIKNKDSDITHVTVKKAESKDAKPKRKEEETVTEESRKKDKYKDESHSSDRSKKKKHKHDKDRDKHRHGKDGKHEKHREKLKQNGESKVKSSNSIDKNDVSKKVDKKPEKPKRVTKPGPPPMNFNDILKLAETKQYEPIVIEKKISEKDKRPMTQEEKEREAYRKSKEYKIWYKTGKMPNKPKEETLEKNLQKSTGNNLSVKVNSSSSKVNSSSSSKTESNKGASDKSKSDSSAEKLKDQVKEKGKGYKEPMPLNPYMDFRDMPRPSSKSKSASSDKQKYSESNESVLICGPSSGTSGPKLYNPKDRERGDPKESTWDRIYNQVKRKHAKSYGMLALFLCI